MKKKKPVIKLVLADDEIKELKQELEIRINDNAELHAKLCNALLQLEEANKVIKHYAYSNIGFQQEDGTYIVAAEQKGCGVVKTVYDPRPAKQYLEKWEVQ